MVPRRLSRFREIEGKEAGGILNKGENMLKSSKTGAATGIRGTEQSAWPLRKACTLGTVRKNRMDLVNGTVDRTAAT